jgi:hypothetical protein
MQTDKAANAAVFDSVFGSERDRDGDEAQPPTTEVSPAAVTPPEKTPVAPDAEAAAEAAEEAANAGRMVPLNEMTRERKKLKGQLTETERRAITAEAEAKALRDLLTAQGVDPSKRPTASAEPPKPAAKAKAPDPVLNPNEFAEYVANSNAADIADIRLDRSEERVRDKFGDELVDKALAAATEAGHVASGAFLDADPKHPWGKLVEWYQGASKAGEVLQTVGEDLAAYNKRIGDEAVAKALADLKAGRTPGQAPETEFPGTLAAETAQGKSGGHLTTAAAMQSVFATDRKRKS